MTTPCERIKEERIRLGMTQTDFGSLVGVKKSVQSRYEIGRSPDANYLAAIAAVGADVSYILTGKRSLGTAAEDVVVMRDLKERELLENYRRCPSDVKRSIVMMCEMGAERGNGSARVMQNSSKRVGLPLAIGA